MGVCCGVSNQADGIPLNSGFKFGMAPRKLPKTLKVVQLSELRSSTNCLLGRILGMLTLEKQ